MKVLNFVKRLVIYLVGFAIIAVGINVSKLSGLGISPVSSIPGVLSKSFDFSLGSMVIVVYCALVLAQLIVLRRRFRPVNILGVPVAIVFGLMVDFLGVSKFTPTLAGINIGITKEFTGLMASVPAPESYPLRLVYLLASIVIIGIGVFIYLSPKLVPMPAEGLAKAISDVSGKSFGNCKTAVDMSMILIALVLQLIFLGGFSSFSSANVVVREGTVISAFCVGQVVKLLNRIFRKNK